MISSYVDLFAKRDELIVESQELRERLVNLGYDNIISDAEQLLGGMGESSTVFMYSFLSSLYKSYEGGINEQRRGV